MTRTAYSMLLIQQIVDETLDEWIDIVTGYIQQNIIGFGMSYEFDTYKTPLELKSNLYRLFVNVLDLDLEQYYLTKEQEHLRTSGIELVYDNLVTYTKHITRCRPVSVSDAELIAIVKQIREDDKRRCTVSNAPLKTKMMSLATLTRLAVEAHYKATYHNAVPLYRDTTRMLRSIHRSIVSPKVRRSFTPDDTCFTFFMLYDEPSLLFATRYDSYLSASTVENIVGKVWDAEDIQRLDVGNTIGVDVIEAERALHLIVSLASDNQRVYEFSRKAAIAGIQRCQETEAGRAFIRKNVENLLNGTEEV